LLKILIFNPWVGIGSYLARIWFAIGSPPNRNHFPTHIQQLTHKTGIPESAEISGAQTIEL